ncbi:hypothetical protein AD941_06710 [Gluconobacter albidus]|uniref:Transmembrane protein n=1 Tax=Gluconobacter albidus TaxID=318683 RepID=A0AAW3QYH8_9PROT|nr:hypothetical protein AD941_06710 [Gluconobacter albidus]
MLNWKREVHYLQKKYLRIYLTIILNLLFLKNQKYVLKIRSILMIKMYIKIIILLFMILFHIKKVRIYFLFSISMVT